MASAGGWYERSRRRGGIRGVSLAPAVRARGMGFVSGVVWCGDLGIGVVVILLNSVRHGRSPREQAVSARPRRQLAVLGGGAPRVTRVLTSRARGWDQIHFMRATKGRNFIARAATTSQHVQVRRFGPCNVRWSLLPVRPPDARTFPVQVLQSGETRKPRLD